MTLRAYQRSALESVDAFVRAGHRSILVVSPTGTGKTRTLTARAVEHTQRGGVVLWVAHRKELLGQASGALRDVGLTPELDCYVRSIQELRNGDGPECSMLVVDEAHHLPSDDWSRLRTEQYPTQLLVGATATPERGDGRGLGFLFTALVVAISVRDAIAQGYLVKPDVIRPDRALGPGELAQDPVEAYCQYAHGTKAIFFHPTVEIAIATACELRARGVSSAAIWGDMPKKDRERIIAAFSAGLIQTLTSVNVLTEGFDVPDVETVVLARGYGTSGQLIQAVGRGLRPSKGKDRCLILDLRGNTHDHGEPDDERTFHLEGRGIRRPSDDIDVRFCPVCGSPTVTTQCEECGHSGAMKLRKPRVLGLPMDRFARVRSDDDEARAVRLARWLGECEAKRWKEGRAMHRYNGAYGAWPTHEVKTRARELAREAKAANTG